MHVGELFAELLYNVYPAPLSGGLSIKLPNSHSYSGIKKPKKRVNIIKL